VNYVLAVLSLGALCALWYAVQRWVGKPDQPLCSNPDRDCDRCSAEEEPRTHAP
jgi:hypothetical protein